MPLYVIFDDNLYFYIFLFFYDNTAIAILSLYTQIRFCMLQLFLLFNAWLDLEWNITWNALSPLMGNEITLCNITRNIMYYVIYVWFNFVYFQGYICIKTHYKSSDCIVPYFWCYWPLGRCYNQTNVCSTAFDREILIC